MNYKIINGLVIFKKHTSSTVIDLSKISQCNFHEITEEFVILSGSVVYKTNATQEQANKFINDWKNTHNVDYL